MTAAPLSPARPVTPIGIAAELLVSVETRLAGAGVDSDVLSDVRRAHALVGGLDPYLAANAAPESADLAELARRTASVDWVGRRADSGPALEQEMLSGHVEGAFLAFLVRLTKAHRVLEIGMFTGYSALAMAEALPEGGVLVACELDAYAAEVASDAFAGSTAGGRIRVEVGPALETLERLADVGESFDLVFVDADKAGYAGYLDTLLTGGLLAPDGLVCVDNTLLQGEPWVGAEAGGAVSDNGTAIAEFNAGVAADPRVEQVIVPLRDGITLIRRADPSGLR